MSEPVCASASKDIEIRGVQLLDSSGTPEDAFRKGRPITVRIQYRTSRPIVNPHFAVDVFRGDGVYCAGINTRMDRRSFGTLDGHGQVDLVVDSRRLLSGSYVVSVGILDAHGRHTFDVHHRAYPFSIASKRRELALIHLDTDWYHRRLQTSRAVSEKELVQ
jgi:hypothetical protein